MSSFKETFVFCGMCRPWLIYLVLLTGNVLHEPRVTFQRGKLLNSGLVCLPVWGELKELLLVFSQSRSGRPQVPAVQVPSRPSLEL